MLRELSKVKIEDEKIVIDSAKHYRTKNEIKIHLNESKLKSPIVLIDPTYKERNALASLSLESFKKFQKAGREFLAHPSKSYFEARTRNIDEMKKKAERLKAEFVSIMLKTDKPAGDVAGTKMQKFYRFLEQSLERDFEVLDKIFEYKRGHEARVCFVLKSRGFVLRKGPPISMSKEASIFKKMHKGSFVKDKRLWARIKTDKKAKDFLKRFSEDKKQLDEMSITEMIV
jgi:tRNA nucleotidyltransferase (CCA-adding enzyme)